MILPQLLGLKVRHNFIEDFGGAILHRANNAEQHAAGDRGSRSDTPPRLAFQGFLAVDVALAQGADGEAHPLGFAPPTRTGQGKAPEHRFVFIEHNDLTPTCPVLQGSEFE